MFYGLIVVIVLQQLNFIGCQKIPNIPCPNIFDYVYDGYKWSAVITVPTPDVYKVVMTVNLTVGELYFNDYGKLTLNDKDNAIKNIEDYLPFKYTLTLPKTKKIPQVTGITYNNNVICRGPGLEPPSTSFWLTHTLNWYSSAITFPREPNNSQHSTNYPPSTTNVIPSSKPKKKKNKYRNFQSCGMVRNKRNIDDDEDVVPFIYNGTVIPRNNHPWLTALYDTDAGAFNFFCGGNLISNKHVLTAAHCTINKRNIQVKVGARNAQELFDVGSILRDAMRITNHEEYVPGSGHADISLILLKEDVEFIATIKPICLWNTEENINAVVGRTGTIMGWGLTESGDQSTTPLQTDIKIASQQQCKSVEILRNSISDMTFCAGTKGAGPCMGDSGGGLFLKIHGRWYLRGIISVSIANRRLNVCDVNTYAVYVDTAKYVDWIVDNMK